MSSRLPGFLLVGTLLAGCGRAGEPIKKASGDAPDRKDQTAVTQSSGEVARQESKPAVPAAARPVVFSARELVKVLDVAAMEILPGSKFYEKTSAALQGTVPGKVGDVAAFYQKQLLAQGFANVPIPGMKITDDYGSFQYGKDGHLAALSVNKADNTKDNEPQTSVQLIFHGNFDSRSLPKRDDKWTYQTQPMSMYATPNKVPEEASWVTESLAAAGWQQYGAFNAGGGDVGDSRNLSFRKQGYTLSVFIVVAPAQGNKTSVQYYVRALAHELPAPPDATKVQFDDAGWKLRCDVPAAMKAVAEFYQKAMPAAGYKPLSGEEPQPTYWNLRYGTDAGDIVVVQVSGKDMQNTKVSIFGVSAAVLADAKKREEQKATTSKDAAPTAPPAQKLPAADVPLPKDAKNQQYHEAKEEITFKSATDIPKLIDQYREQLTGAGWQEDKAFAVVTKNAGSLSLKQGAAKLDITLINTGLGDGTQVSIRAKGLTWRKAD